MSSYQQFILQAQSLVEDSSHLSVDEEEQILDASKALSLALLSRQGDQYPNSGGWDNLQGGVADSYAPLSAVDGLNAARYDYHPLDANSPSLNIPLDRHYSSITDSKNHHYYPRDFYEDGNLSNDHLPLSSLNWNDSGVQPPAFLHRSEDCDYISPACNESGSNQDHITSQRSWGPQLPDVTCEERHLDAPCADQLRTAQNSLKASSCLSDSHSCLSPVATPGPLKRSLLTSPTVEPDRSPPTVVNSPCNDDLEDGYIFGYLNDNICDSSIVYADHALGGAGPSSTTETARQLHSSPATTAQKLESEVSDFDIFRTEMPATLHTEGLSQSRPDKQEALNPHSFFLSTQRVLLDMGAEPTTSTHLNLPTMKNASLRVPSLEYSAPSPEPEAKLLQTRLLNGTHGVGQQFLDNEQSVVYRARKVRSQAPKAAGAIRKPQNSSKSRKGLASISISKDPKTGRRRACVLCKRDKKEVSCTSFE